MRRRRGARSTTHPRDLPAVGARSMDVARWVEVGRRQPSRPRPGRRRPPVTAPTSAASAVTARCGVPPTPNRATPAFATVPRRVAPRPPRRPGRSHRDGGPPRRRRSRTRPPHTGNSTAVRISSSAMDGHEGGLEELCRRRRGGSPTALAIYDGGVEGDGHRRVFGRRVGMGDGTAEGAAVADLEMPDERGGLGHQRGAGRDDRRSRRPRPGSSWRRTVTVPLTRSMPSSSSTRPEVDEVLEPGQAQGQDRDQALSSGEHLGVLEARPAARPPRSAWSATW